MRVRVVIKSWCYGGGDIGVMATVVPQRMLSIAAQLVQLVQKVGDRA